MNDEKTYALRCEYDGDSGKLREAFNNLLKPEDRIDKLILKKYEDSGQGNFPNREITVVFFSRKSKETP